MIPATLPIARQEPSSQHETEFPSAIPLLDELVSVRLRRNTLGVYRLDHDSGQHDDQAVALALGTHYLLDADGDAESWIRWARRKAEIAAGLIPPDPLCALRPPWLRRSRNGNPSSRASCPTLPAGLPCRHEEWTGGRDQVWWQQQLRSHWAGCYGPKMRRSWPRWPGSSR